MRRFLLWTLLVLIGWIAPGDVALALEKGSGFRVQGSGFATKRQFPSPEPRTLNPDLFFRLSPLEERLFADAADGRLDEFSPLEAALIASGVNRVEVLQHYQRQQAALVDELRRSGTVAGPPQKRARTVFEFMHRRVLHAGYRTDCTDLRMALDHGRFNCVSASVLFNCLTGEFDLPVCGLESPGHAMSRLTLPEGTIDVQTTCPRWFRLMNDPARQAELVEKTLGAAASNDRSKAREVSPIEMAAMIYYNRGVDLLAGKKFAEAAAANAKALRLDPASTTARGNLLATLNNWALDLGQSRRYAEAVDLLRQALAVDPHYEMFATNFVHLHHQWVEHLCGAGRYGRAMNLLGRAAADVPEEPYFRQAALDVYRRWARAFQTGAGG